MISLIFVFITSCDVTEPPPVPDLLSIDSDPAWSPDGNWIAYHHLSIEDESEDSYSTGLYLIDTSGNNREMLVDGNYLSPDWSPDGKKLVITNGSIFILDISTQDLAPFTDFNSVFFPAWSPDGEKIAFDATSMGEQNGIWIANVDGTNRANLGLGRNPDWAPDNTMLVYQGPSGETDAENQIWKAGTNGSNITQLTSNNIAVNRAPTWSPDGNTIVWWVNPEGMYSSNIWIMDQDGNNKRILTFSDTSPSWSPSSDKIVFPNITENGEKTVLWIIGIDGNGLKQLTKY